jgi:hypothetical protein
MALVSVFQFPTATNPGNSMIEIVIVSDISVEHHSLPENYVTVPAVQV